MYQPIPFKEEYIKGIRISGKIDKTTFINAMQEVLPQEKMARLNLYIEIEPEEGFTWQSLWQSFKFGISKGQELMQELDKIAVVSSEAWLRTYTSLENVMVSGIEEKAFNEEDKNLAKDWLKH